MYMQLLIPTYCKSIDLIHDSLIKTLMVKPRTVSTNAVDPQTIGETNTEKNHLYVQLLEQVKY